LAIKTDPETFPPDGDRLNYHGFNLTEVFLRDDFEALDEGLRRFLSRVEWAATFEQEDRLANLSGFMARTRTAFMGTASMNVAYVRRREVRRPGIPLAAYTELPSWVHSLNPWVHHVLPSLVALTLFVILEPEATEEVNGILRTTYVSEESPQKGVTRYPAATIKAQHVENCLWRIRKSVESILASHVQWVFLSAGEAILPLCPAIDVLSLSHIPMDDDERAAGWLDQHNRFLSCIGIRAIPDSGLRYDQYLLFQSRFPAVATDHWQAKQEKALRVLSSLDLFRTELWTGMYGSAEDALVHNGEEVFREVGLVYALSHLVTLESDAVARLRWNCTTSFGKERQGPEVSLPNLEDTFKTLHLLRSKVDTMSFRLARLGHELESQKRFIARNLPNFRPIRPPSFRPEEEPFPQNMLDFAESRIAVLRHETRLLEERIEDEMALTSARLDLELALRMDKLTVLMAVLAVASAVLALVAILPALTSLLSTIVSVFLSIVLLPRL
jgi:hypothetical protein